MTDANGPHWVFGQTPSGFLLPRGLSFGDVVFPFQDPADIPDRRTRTIGVVPTYEDLWDGPRPALDDLIAAIPLGHWLGLLSRIATILAREAMPESEKCMVVKALLPEEQGHRLDAFLRRSKNAQPIMDFQVLLLMELAAARAAIDSASAPVMKHVHLISQALYVVSSELHEPSVRRIRESPAGTAGALFERSILGGTTKSLLTAFGAWVWEHPELDEDSRTARSRFDDYLRAQFDLSLADWVIGVSLAALLFEVHPPKQVLRSALTLSRQSCGLNAAGSALMVRCLELLSTTLEDLQGRCRAWDQDRGLLASPTLLELMSTPCWKLEADAADFLALSPLHLAGAAFWRPLVARRESKENRSAASDEFGHVIEGYVHGLLRSHFGERYERLPDSGGGKSGPKRADGVVWLEAGYIVVECKARRSSEWGRFQDRSDADYRAELDRSGLKSAVAQIEATIEAIEQGDIEHRCGVEPGIAASMIVFLQETALSPVAGSVLEEVLPQSTRRQDGVLQLRPQVMPVQDLEGLDKWRHLGLPGVLARKMFDADVSLERLDDYLLSEGERPGTSETRSRLWAEVFERLRAYGLRET